ncbi:coiled-coil domain-containing protein 152-like [Morone saxatilis]|uniref:coiled-coil domain-containing protein 152-like n=1 Tax=Morone saxatilis TaxID=34816 RepID=UPI0015E1F370|nr:coiled-coil domain-containing protein 152-like [Morone saxatilis]
MIKLNGVSLENFMEKFTQLEEKITEVNGKNNMLEIMLEDANRLMKFYLTKEKSLIEERNSLLVTVDRLQQTLQEQCSLREENERLKNDMAELKQQNERTVKDGEAEVQRLVSEMRVAGERHKRELETVRQQWRREVEEAHRQGLHQLEAKDTEVKKLLEEKDLDLEEMKKRLKEQERERQSELLKLQMEFGARLARVESTAQMSQQQQQQQQHGSSLLPQSVFKRKLQFFQEEKNKEIVALRQRIKELEENQRPCGFSDGRLKRRKI